MTPILQTESAVIGFLPDALSGVVTEKPGGIYELDLTCPVSDPMISSLSIDDEREFKNPRFSEFLFFSIKTHRIGYLPMRCVK